MLKLLVNDKCMMVEGSLAYILTLAMCDIQSMKYDENEHLKLSSSKEPSFSKCAQLEETMLKYMMVECSLALYN